jgi:iron complex outermembrane receptor protein
MRALTDPMLTRQRRAGLLWRASSVAIATLLMAGTSALAADRSSGEASGASAEAATSALPEITVTAQFRAQNLQNTPVAITAVNAAMMDARSETSIYQVAMQAPSVTLKPQGAAWGASLAASIRGVGQYDFNPALEPGVGMYVDDVYYATLTGSIFDLLDLDRVEILRGPQGTLAGRNSIGGAVKLYSKKPGEGDSYISAAYGSRNRVDFRGSADFKISDTLGARISGVSKSQQGYVNRVDYGCANPGSGIPAITNASLSGCVLDREGQVNYDGVRGMLRWDNNGPLDVTIIGDYTRDDHANAGEVITYANNTNPAVNPFGGSIVYDNRFYCGPYCNYASYYNPAQSADRPANIQSDRVNYSGWGFSGHVNYDFGSGIKLQSITAYRAYNEEFANDGDLSPMTIGLGQSNLTFWSFSQELRLNGQLLDDMLEYTIGGFYMDQKSVYATMQDLRYSPLIPFQGDDPVKSKSKAGFVHLSYHATDKMTVIGGLRYTDESKSYTYLRRKTDGSPYPFLLNGLDGVTGTYAKGRFDYRAAAQYQWTDNIMTYAQYSTGFKGGGINPRPFYKEQVQPFGPEKLNTAEIGVKSDLFDGRMRLNADAYFGWYKDIQLTALSCPAFTPGGAGPCALPLNAGNAHTKGVEVETTIQPVEGLSIDGSASYIDFGYTTINPLAGHPANTSGPAAGVQLGMITPYTPTWKLSGGIQYEIPVENIGSVTPRFDVAYQGKMYSNAVNGPNNLIPSYAIANARITWRDENNKWEASLEVTNLFDKYYYLTNFDLSSVSGTSLSQPGRPREWAITIKRSF